MNDLEARGEDSLFSKDLVRPSPGVGGKPSQMSSGKWKGKKRIDRKDVEYIWGWSEKIEFSRICVESWTHFLWSKFWGLYLWGKKEWKVRSSSLNFLQEMHHDSQNCKSALLFTIEPKTITVTKAEISKYHISRKFQTNNVFRRKWHIVCAKLHRYLN